MANPTTTNNGTTPVNRVASAPVAPVSRFKRLLTKFDKIGVNKKAGYKDVTEDGTITATVAGKVCLDTSDLIGQAAIVGVKMSTKGVTGVTNSFGIPAEYAGSAVSDLVNSEEA